MARIASSALILALTTTTAMAASEGKFSKYTVDGITKALAGAKCTPGDIHSGSGYYQVAKAQCADGLYDIKVDTDFKIIEQKKKD
ncbi:MAG: hypothetical protein NW217_10175 [Hyphomicrobiaceae bacterium]|nr:hypothetical protein [Hyphomicrobiaceae bacterium]